MKIAKAILRVLLYGLIPLAIVLLLPIFFIILYIASI